jgi:hypothetical protein
MSKMACSEWLMSWAVGGKTYLAALTLLSLCYSTLSSLYDAFPLPSLLLSHLR